MQHTNTNNPHQLHIGSKPPLANNCMHTVQVYSMCNKQMLTHIHDADAGKKK